MKKGGDENKEDENEGVFKKKEEEGEDSIPLL